MNIIWFLVVFLLTISRGALAQSNSTSLKKTGEVKNWRANYFSYLNGPTLQDSTETSINHYLELGRSIKGGWSLSAVARWDDVWVRDQGSETETGDHFLKLVYPTLYESDSTTIKGQFQYYIPSSEASRNKGMISAMTPRFQLASALAKKIDFTYLLLPTYYSYEEEQPAQVVASHAHYASMAYMLTRDVTLDLGAYPKWTYYRNGVKEFNDFPIYPGVSSALTDNLSLSGYLEILAARPQKKTTMVGGTVSYIIL